MSCSVGPRRSSDISRELWRSSVMLSAIESMLLVSGPYLGCAAASGVYSCGARLVVTPAVCKRRGWAAAAAASHFACGARAVASSRSASR